MPQIGREYYLSHKPEIMAQFTTHARAWMPWLTARFGEEFAETISRESRERYEALISEIPYIGGEANPMTRHLVRSTTSLILYQVMKAHGKKAEDAGHILYQGVEASVSQLPKETGFELNTELIADIKEQVRRSQMRQYTGDWVQEYVEGNGAEFDYGIDFLECGTQKLYHAYGADEFLPLYCYLDFVTYRTVGWGFDRSGTLAEGYSKCDFRWKKGGETRKGWPPPFLLKG
jgi:hypothetical protein